jgi:putative transcriptional regulator
MVGSRKQLCELAAVAFLAIALPVQAGAEPFTPGLDTSEIKPGTLLIAARQLRDPNFGESVVLLFEHGSKGSIGTIINRRTHVSISEVLPGIPELANRDDSLYLGGPVHRNTISILVRSATPLAQGHLIFADIYYLDEALALRQLAAETPPLEMRFYAGYAGWGPDQLSAEILRGDWHIAPADPGSVFAADADTVWPTLIKRFSGLWTVR